MFYKVHLYAAKLSLARQHSLPHKAQDVSNAELAALEIVNHTEYVGTPNKVDITKVSFTMTILHMLAVKLIT